MAQTSRGRETPINKGDLTQEKWRNPHEAGLRAMSVDAVFDALASERRRSLLAELVRVRSASAAELARSVGISRQGVSKHMAVLSRAELVVREREWRSVRFRPASDALFGALAWIAQIGSAEAEALRSGR